MATSSAAANGTTRRTGGTRAGVPVLDVGSGGGFHSSLIPGSVRGNQWIVAVPSPHVRVTIFEENRQEMVATPAYGYRSIHARSYV